MNKGTKERSERNLEIARTIINQMGGNRVKMFTGTKQFVAIDNGVQFRFPNRSGYNFVSITLTGSDLYNMRFCKIRKYDIAKEETIEEMYFDQLIETFENKTGLYLHF